MESIYDATILLVDDEPELLQMLKTLLLIEGFANIKTASTGKEALQVIKEQSPHAILLDIMLPDINGFTLIEQLNQFTNAPVIFVSARDEDTARLKGLGLGADDYITKPFLPDELMLRLCAVIRRTYGLGNINKSNKIYMGETVVDMGNSVVMRDKLENTLTAKEYAILQKLNENRGNIFTIDSLCRAVWHDENFGYENTLMVHIRRLREKIEVNPSEPKFLITVRGLGYRLAKEETI